MKNKTLTKADWLEIYCALQSKKSSPTVDGDARWQKHLDRIMAKIGPDGEDAFNRQESAPELLAALQSAVKYLEEYRPKGNIRDIFTQLNAHENGALKPARAAIAKATGQD